MPQPDATQLREFLEASKAKGASDEFLAAFLVRRGWSADDVYGAIGNYWERVTGIAAPTRAARGESARDAFLYLLAFSTLGTWAVALGSMLFDLINYRVPDAVSANVTYDLRSAVTSQMAAMAVAFPLYLLVMRTIVREAAAQPERLASGVRRWLTYIALWATAVTLVCDLICTVDYFLKGELSERFALKAITVMLIAGAIFLYYRSAAPRHRLFGAAAAAAVVATFCLGLAVAGTPARQRKMEADEKRVQDLQQIGWAVQAWKKEHGTIPPRLAELNVARITDLETGAPYEYHPKSDTLYDLCAQFAGREPAGETIPGFWRHGAGRTCFALDASETLR